MVVGLVILIGTCYFLLDNGECTNDNKIEVLWYRFTGLEEPLLESPYSR